MTDLRRFRLWAVLPDGREIVDDCASWRKVSYWRRRAVMVDVAVNFTISMADFLAKSVQTYVPRT